MSGEPTVVSIFAGCGGSSLGYRWAGFHEPLAIDLDPVAMETLRMNLTGTTCWVRDIRGVSGEEILGECGLDEGELGVLDGSPASSGQGSS